MLTLLTTRPHSPPSRNRVMKKNDIPPDLHEALFLSCIVHASDHTLIHRIQWGKVFNLDTTDTFKPGTW